MSNRRIQQLKYQWREGSRFAVDAETAGSELDRIQQENGVVTPAAVVDAARPDEAPLHPAFEWRDPVAAEKYRTWQARNLIKSVTVVRPEHGPSPSPVYVHVPSQTNGGYQPVSIVVQRPDMFAAAIADLQKRLQSAHDSLESVKKTASEQPETDADRMARIALAAQALQTASAAVSALH